MQLNEFEAQQLESSIRVAEKKLNIKQGSLEGKLYGQDKASFQRSTLASVVSRVEDLENRAPELEAPLVELTPSDDLEAVKKIVNQISVLLNNSRI